jgi:hypothetical protein
LESDFFADLQLPPRLQKHLEQAGAIVISCPTMSTS